MKRPYILVLLIFLSQCFFTVLIMSSEQPSQDVMTIDSASISMLQKPKPPAYGLVLYLEVEEKNYDNFDKELPGCNLSPDLAAARPESYGIDAEDWVRAEKHFATHAILDGVIYPYNRYIKNNALIFKNLRSSVIGPSTSLDRHPVVLVYWKISMEGNGRKNGCYDRGYLFPIDSIPFQLATLYTNPFSGGFENIRFPMGMNFTWLTPYGWIDISCGNYGWSLNIGDKVTDSTKQEYPNGTFNDMTESESKLYDEYIKGKDLIFRTETTITNKGYYLIKWPSSQ